MSRYKCYDVLQAHSATLHCTAVTRYKNRCMQITAQEICWELHDKLIPLQLEPGYWVTGLVIQFYLFSASAL